MNKIHNKFQLALCSGFIVLGLAGAVYFGKESYDSGKKLEYAKTNYASAEIIQKLEKDRLWNVSMTIACGLELLTLGGTILPTLNISNKK